MDKTIPKHVAMIMDGNGRWANSRGEERTAGHKEGAQNVRNIALAASQRGIQFLTLYAFSTENWSRPTKEVEYLCRLPKVFLDRYLNELIENNIRVVSIGELDKFPKETREAITYATKKTEHLTGLVLCIAVNYGGRRELALAAKAMMDDATFDQSLEGEALEVEFSKHLQSAILPDVDLLIRTSGEMRVSNFLLWKLAYSEFIFCECAWPDFTAKDLDECLLLYQKRNRRYGGIQ